MTEELRVYSLWLTILFAVVLDSYLWQMILTATVPGTPVLSALDVGQGDATLVQLPGGVVVLTDAGPDASVVGKMDLALRGRKRIDLAFISHPQADHFNGFNYLLKDYYIGAFVISGREADPGVASWANLLQKIRLKGIPLIALSRGDRIRFGTARIDILSPDISHLMSGELNDTSLIERVETTDWTAMLMGDANFITERWLASTSLPQVDILKIGHHGSRYSTDPILLQKLRPRAATISVGSGNTYGHPAAEVLDRLRSAGAALFRTDKNGTVTIKRDGDFLSITTERLLE